MSNENTWDEWSKFLIKEVERISNNLNCIEQKIDMLNQNVSEMYPLVGEVSDLKTTVIGKDGTNGIKSIVNVHEEMIGQLKSRLNQTMTFVSGILAAIIIYIIQNKLL